MSLTFDFGDWQVPVLNAELALRTLLLQALTVSVRVCACACTERLVQKARSPGDTHPQKTGRWTRRSAGTDFRRRVREK